MPARPEALRGGALLERLLAIPLRDRDAWVDALLGLDEPLPDDAELPPGAVPYLPCGVEEILAAVRELPLERDHVFVDLGSGVGRVSLLAHLLTGARCQGIEVQAALVERSLKAASALGLPSSDVAFTHANVLDVKLSGSVFFLYAPFNGPMLTAVLQKLEALAKTHPISLCCAGLELNNVPWLKARTTSSLSLMLYESRASPSTFTATKSRS